MTHHILRTTDVWFDRVADGSKTAEVRKHDRDFQVDDVLSLVREQFYEGNAGTNAKVIDVRITHILPASVFPEGLCSGYSLLSFTDVTPVRLCPHNAHIIRCSRKPRG